MEREEEYKQKCRQVKDYYRRLELEELDRQYREGEPLTGCGIALQ